MYLCLFFFASHKSTKSERAHSEENDVCLKA